MKIAVCIKQVPLPDAVTMDPERRTLVREGVANQLNPFDRRGIAQALELRDRFGGEVVAITMGPPQAEETLRGALGNGVDRAVHLCDPCMAGADTLATARTLATYLRRESFDLIFCGKYSTDSDTGQVGPEVATLLDLPHVSGVTGLEVIDNGLRVEQETDDGIDVVEIALPALLTTAERLIRGVPHPTPASLASVVDRPVERLTAEDLGLSPGEVGLAGSPTQVVAIDAPAITRTPEIREMDDPSAACDWLLDRLEARGAFATGRRDGLVSLPTLPADRREDRRILVVAETLGDGLRPVTLELLGGAVQLAASARGSVRALVIGSKAGRHVAELVAHGAEVVYLAEGPRLERYNAERYAEVLARAIAASRPWAVLAPATSQGRDYVPRTAAALGLGLTGDAVDLVLDPEGRLLQRKPAFGGTIIASIVSRVFPQMATVRAGMLTAFFPDSGRTARVERLDVANLPDGRTRLIEQTQIAAPDELNLDNADRIVCLGNGLERPENLVYGEQLAEALGARLASTRRVTDAGWMPRQLQIGMTGRSVAPQLYVGIGVHGAIEHTIGIRRSGTIVAINTDRTAPIFDQCDLGLVGDYRLMVPALAAALQRRETPLTPTLSPAGRGST
jgi:electron transfer flavoprotein alpha subunit